MDPRLRSPNPPLDRMVLELLQELRRRQIEPASPLDARLRQMNWLESSPERRAWEATQERRRRWRERKQAERRGRVPAPGGQA